MKLQLYKYTKGKTNLDFNFPEDENLNQNKKDFIDLLAEAQEELKKELNLE